MADKPQNPVAAAALAGAHEVYNARCRLLARFDTASAIGIGRFADIVHRLSDADLDRMARFAEGLAEWPDDDIG